MTRASRLALAALALLAASVPALAVAPDAARAAGKISLYLTRMDPSDVDARRFSRTSWGGGLSGVLPVPAVHNLFALTSGIEIANMLSHSIKVYDPVIDENLKQTTSQSYGRFYVGGRLGPHGSGFVRPHVGANVAIVWYGISTSIEIPNPEDPSSPNSKTLDSNYKMAFGYDVNAGLDLNIANRIPIELGVRHLQSLNVPQPLGEGSVLVTPSYFQYYFGVGVSLEAIRGH